MPVDLPPVRKWTKAAWFIGVSSKEAGRQVSFALVLFAAFIAASIIAMAAHFLP
jgi:predicted ester cyclase